MKEHFQNILDDYSVAYNEDISKHPLAKVLTDTIPKLIASSLIEKERYIIKGSAGAGNWTVTPWIAIFDILVTNTAQSGYYPVFLFRDDMSGFYLSLNQGVTEIKQKYKKEAKQVLKVKAEDYRAQLNIIPSAFDKLEIKLKNSKTTKSSLPSLYEAGNVIAKFYSAYDIPESTQLRLDILEMLKIYEVLSYNEGLPSTQGEIENDEQDFKGYEDLRKFRFHKRIERNVQLSKKVKKAQGFTCKACYMNFKKVYGVLGNDFIEAHHLIPIAKLSKEKIQLDVKKDFVVLCSNCHSMIHKLSDPSNLSELRQIIKSQLEINV
jgi:5-methylcytosine-specific restriction protein A